MNQTGENGKKKNLFWAQFYLALLAQIWTLTFFW